MRLYHYFGVRDTERQTDRIKNSAVGASLVNVLFSMALSIVLIVGALQWYQVLKKVVIEQSVKRQNLDIGRIAFQFLMNDANASGYKGCRTLDDNFAIHRAFVDYGHVGKFSRIDRLIFGFQNSPGVCQSHLPGGACERIKKGGHAVILYNVPLGGGVLKQDMKHPDDAIVIRGQNRIQKNAMVLITDCLAGDLFMANDVQGDKVFHQKSPRTNQSGNFSKIYKKGTEVTELQAIAYYLGGNRSATLCSQW